MSTDGERAFSGRLRPFVENVRRFRGGLVFKAHRLCVSLNSRLQGNQEEEEDSSFVDVLRGRLRV